MSIYYRISLKGGNTYTQPEDELFQAIDAEFDGISVGETIVLTFTKVEMSEDEYARLPEFEGH